MTTKEQITTALALPSPDVLAAQAKQASVMLVDVVVSSDAELQLMTDELRQAKAKRDAIEDRRLQITRPLDQSKASVMDLFRAPLAIMDAAIEAGKRACLTYTRERDARIAREQREAQEKADAERRRLQAEADALALKARQEAMAGNAAVAEATAAVATQKMQEALTTVAPIYTAPARTAGAHQARRWTVRITDKRSLVYYLLDKDPQLFDAAVNVDEAKLRSWATLHNGQRTMPGMEVIEATSMVLR